MIVQQMPGVFQGLLVHEGRLVITGDLEVIRQKIGLAQGQWPQWGGGHDGVPRAQPAANPGGVHRAGIQIRLLCTRDDRAVLLYQIAAFAVLRAPRRGMIEVPDLAHATIQAIGNQRGEYKGDHPQRTLGREQAEFVPQDIPKSPRASRSPSFGWLRTRL